MSAYQKLDERVPAYESGALTYEVNLEAQMATVQAVPERLQINAVYINEIHACCIIASVLNFICCSCFGIPALIFTILGVEADTRRDKEIAQRHRLYMFIFNIVGCILFWVRLGAYIVSGFVYYEGITFISSLLSAD